jgi:GNAT superfamily N-acetyltransferase
VEEIRIQPLRSEFLDEVILIHQGGLGYTLNSRLGKKHLAFLYDSMQHDPDCHVGVALAGGRPVGVVSGTLNAARLRSRLLRSMPLDRLAAIAVRLMLQPWMIVQWLQENAIGGPMKRDGQEVVAELTTLAVAASHRGLGAGRRLVIDLERFFSKCNVGSYRLETLVANGAARAFYGGLGFAEIARRGSSVVLLKAVGR